MSKQNKKLKKTLIFDLPSGKTCPKANECLAYVEMNAKGKTVLKEGKNSIFRCFAASQENQYPNVYKARKYNLDLILKSLKGKYGFYRTYELIHNSIQKHKTRNINKVRIHSSGDFFSGEYLRCWFAVARLNPLMKFYCYSKSLHLFGTNVSIPENFFLTASMGGLRDDLIHKGFFKRYAIVVNSEAEAIKKGIEHMGKPYKIDKDDSSCFKPDPFALLIHGTQKKGYFKNLKK
ncbi:MAG: hypothetical protein MK084_08910 [Prochlorococcus sp. ALOHA_A2.0_50]|nr:hypothetical protein [Prochlorococcus sp. ALOHA_A2.0_50]